MKNRQIAALTAKLPANVRRFTWVRNHHYVEVEDEQGNKAKLHAGGLVRGECTKCKAVVFATRNEGAMVCPHCLSPVMWAWSKPQLAFLPEHEAQLMGFDAPSVNGAPLTWFQRAWIMLTARGGS